MADRKRDDGIDRPGRMGGDRLGPGGYCLCTRCGTRMPHSTAVPCYSTRCPQCGGPMIRCETC